MAPIPITIVTGFLGSGKTTLILNLVPQLRAANPSYRLALLKNEFGDVAIDSQLASSSAISGVQEMLNGCICCNLVGDLSKALEELCGGDSPPDRVIIETSGSAFPATLAMEVNRLARVTGGAYALDGVIHVIDVENWQGYEDTSYTAKVQARYTDLMVYNKWELCDERRFDQVRDLADEIGGAVHGGMEVDIAWVKSDKGRVPTDIIFGVDRALAQTLDDENFTNVKPHSHGDGDSHADHTHDHQTEVEVLSVTLKGPNKDAAVDSAKLMALLKAAPKEEVYRIKSVLTASSTVRGSQDDESAPTPPHPSARYILNWAFGRWTFTPIPVEVQEHASSDDTTLRMTLILARYQSNMWKKKLETGDFLQLADGVKGELTVKKVV
ncbi:uncharacterized protein PG986_000380 [Apiospora aurea]|uniref:CobW/HypB/UreG nucleotide-binding domain-containing protein n=1 Tax=Apiospora aurea TaxID=335848 RepID=A0ABR1QTW1_9PEZI